MRAYLRKAWLIAWKDLVSEWRSREVFSIMAVFALLTILIFNFALELSSVNRVEVAPGLLWVTFIFAGLLGVNRSFTREQEQGNLAGLMMVPVDRSAIYLGKLMGNLAFIVSVEAVTLPLFAALFNISVPVWPLLVPLLLGTLGFAIIGTVFAAISVNTRLRDVLLPVLVLPIFVPVVIAAVKASSTVFARRSLLEEARHWIGLLVTFDVLFFTLAVLLFDVILEE
ncbi:MAG: heme exporter protein CcmB [Ardenticatenia bacterium]|nr:heme exporter protein CcmB [Ardenticatenia bacterium]